MAEQDQAPNQEPTDAERAKFEQDVLKAAQDAMNLEKNLNENAGEAAEQAQSAEQPAAEKPAEEAQAEKPAEPTAEEKLATELEAANAKVAEANDRYMRLMAEFDNFRRRSAKEQLDLIEVANGKLLEKFADVWENFDRAFAAENKGDFASFEKGMQMIQTQFVKVLTDAGLEQIDPTGAEFDPNCHEALMQQPSETVPEGNVVTVFQKGYKLKNKILKTAKVIVSSGK
ncbi:MAG: nucleotide exchange factor GrpE [Fibrobacter sp.]|nr:nucleotide exchange factor GrpE [Fibrobacter sp.]